MIVSNGRLVETFTLSAVPRLMEAGLIDELPLLVHPVLLGGGKALFAGVNRRLTCSLNGTRELEGGRVELAYAVQPAVKQLTDVIGPRLKIDPRDDSNAREFSNAAV